MRTIMILAFSLFSCVSVQAGEVAQKNCEINVKYFYKTGVDSVRSYRLVAKSKSDCEKKSKLYRENSTPKNVDKKEVEVKWHAK